jgi:hypothetical protein
MPHPKRKRDDVDRLAWLGILAAAVGLLAVINTVAAAFDNAKRLFAFASTFSRRGQALPHIRRKS